ncbi:hypothetical protein OG500_24730 [Kitasatospora sp. NBC_01250]|uniref:hypothetical protein n=1 Tax=unclassified Kitasatospora TaxID=2633591 RepID=UPI002E12162B|nr:MULTISPECIES: hypothetical protein [unclassified Kitasatospora]WSJ69327.1 hypothetical protein OG294_26275 [Kitasatospora sp. NBC_01302]
MARLEFEQLTTDELPGRIGRESPPPGHGRRRLLVWGVLAALVAGAAVTGFWWKPWQSVQLPQSACWGELGPADYRVLAGPDGRAKATTRGGIDGPVANGLLLSSCRLVWNDKHHSSMLSVSIGSADGTDVADDQRLLGSTLRQVGFGPDVTGWFAPGTGPMALQFACAYQQAAAAAKPSPYLRIVVASADLGTASTGSVRAAYADIALKLAKATARRIPCTNQLRMLDQPPALPAG